jgi:hypothetical protein
MFMSYKIYLIDKTHLLSPRGVVEWFKALVLKTFLELRYRFSFGYIF